MDTILWPAFGPTWTAFETNWTTIAVAWIAATLLVGCIALPALRSRPGRLIHHSVFVRAPAQAVWDAYFMHVRRADYRLGRRILDIETLSRDPLTIRATVQMDYCETPNIVTYAFPLYDPPRRYRIKTLSVDNDADASEVAEEGELVEQNGGTLLRFTVRVPRSPWIATWIAGRQVRDNLRALAAFCEGLPVPQPRPPLRARRWEGWLFWAAFLVIILQPPAWVTVPVLALAVPLLLWRGWDTARRLLAI
jgi:hypothetical protein